MLQEVKMKFLPKILFFVSILCCNFISAQEIIKVSNPQEVKSVMSVQELPKDLEGLVWNRWTSENFVVCSINDKQAQYLYKHLEFVKVWAYRRWGFDNPKFSKQCKLICVDDPKIYKKLFNLDSTYVDIRRDESGNIKENIIFLLANDSPSKILSQAVSEICLAELSQEKNVKFNAWAIKGISSLDQSLPQIKEKLLRIKSHLDKDSDLFFSQSLLKIDMNQYKGLSVDQKAIYDSCATAFCLMIRKEFGQDKFHELLYKASKSDPDTVIRDVLGFENCDRFDKSFKRYIMDLTKDLEEGKTPDSYLQISERKFISS